MSLGLLLAAMMAAPSAASDTAANPRPRIGAVENGPPPLCTKISDALYRVDAAAFAEYEAARGTACDIDSREHVSLAKRGGRIIGARVSLSTRSIYAGCGLRSGDIVIEADGAPMVSPESSLLAYQAARAAGRIQLVLLRKGRRVRVALESSTLAESRSGR